jgi:hypothetical protein
MNNRISQIYMNLKSSYRDCQKDKTVGKDELSEARHFRKIAKNNMKAYGINKRKKQFEDVIKAERESVRLHTIERDKLQRSVRKIERDISYGKSSISSWEREIGIMDKKLALIKGTMYLPLFNSKKLYFPKRWSEDKFSFLFRNTKYNVSEMKSTLTRPIDQITGEQKLKLNTYKEFYAIFKNLDERVV